MKGLLEKDRRFCLGQGPTVIVAVVLLAYAFVIGEPILISVECAVIACVYSLTLVLSDDRNGFLFLMTMPVDAKTYVVEKNVFTWIALAVLWLISRVLLILSAIITADGAYRFTEILSFGYICFLVAAVATSVFLPLMLKFGPNSLILVLSMIVLCTTAFLFFVIMNGGLGFGKVLDLFEKLSDSSPVVLAAVSFPATVVLTAIFIRLGILVMKNREF